MKIYHIIIDQSPVNDNAVNIVNLLKNASFINSNMDASDFVQEIQNNVWKLFGIGITIDKTLSLEQQCESLIEQLIEYKLLPLQ
jgi:hypothetical protein